MKLQPFPRSRWNIPRTHARTFVVDPYTMTIEYVVLQGPLRDHRSRFEIGQMDAAVSFLAWVRHSSSPVESGKEWPHSVPGPVYCVRNWPAFVQTRAHHTVLQKRVLLVFVCSIQKQIKDMVVAWKLCVCSSIH